MATIKHLLNINASKETIYKALTTIEGLSKWWTTQTTGDTKIGGIIQFRFNQAGCDMRVLSKRENESITWICIDGFPDWVGTQITIRLEEANGKTKIHFEHANWRETNEFYAGCSFSWGRYLESLRQLCQTGKGEAFGGENYKA